MPNRGIANRRIARTASALALLLALAQPAPGIAQLGSAGSDEGPLRIQSDAGIEWQQNQHVYIARGNAVVARGNNEVRADTLIAHYRDKPGGKPDSQNPASQNPAGQNPDNQTGTAAAPPGGAQTGNSLAGSLTGEGAGSTEIYRVEAIGNIVLKHQASTVVGERAVYDIDQGIAVVTGGNLKLTTATDVVTARDSLEWFDGKQIAVARGDAVATRATKTIKADILTAYMHKSAQPSTKPPPAKAATRTESAGGQPAGGQQGESQISRVDAQGHVVITDTLNTGRGDFGVYNSDTGIATLIGSVVIQRGANVIQGERGVMDLNNNIARMLPGGNAAGGGTRVQGLLVRDQTKSGGSKPEAARRDPPKPDAAPGAERKHP